ncbi:MAG: glycogen phosphorylase [Spirochaeta sp. LUC14_002_19_P3]|nr:MAG: glycogen phosphorylase [Spirochaeta sp. LUC14_002_19_P3]
MEFNKQQFLSRVHYWLDRGAGPSATKTSGRQVYEAISRSVMDICWDKWMDSEHEVNNRRLKRAYYFSAEFLMGRAMDNNLINLGIHKDIAETLTEIGLDFNMAEESETDAALGNGGLGRLAACFLDSLSTLNFPARGYGIRYTYGMFRQKIVNGEQVEQPDDWNSRNDPWSIRRSQYSVIVRFGGRIISARKPNGTFRYSLTDTENIRAIPYDMPIFGWNTNTVNTLRLWEAESMNGFNLQLFNNMEYMRAVETQTRAKCISNVLYPNDENPAGKILRLRQQYFFSSASLQDIIREYKFVYGKDFSQFADKTAIQLNDTHPVISIPELMRLLMDVENLEWESAWDITSKTFAYTNHTVLAEALESWPIDLFHSECPRLMQIVEEINQRFMAEMIVKYPGDQARHHRMSILADGYIKMTHLAIVGSFSVNGVAELHTNILKNKVLKDWYELWPEKFNNKTNGVTQRRWLNKANPSLATLLNQTIGSSWVQNLEEISHLKTMADDTSLLIKLDEVKLTNKTHLANITKQLTEISVNPESLFDMQIKRLHEYKRQLLNILSLIYDWQILQDNPKTDIPPRTIFFGAKAAPGYRRAKQIIHLIHAAADKINTSKACRDRLKIVFIPDYRVSLAEAMFPAAEISQQISTAGKEASGTGNMKFMMNGAITLGTLDGANIEIVQEVGQENAFIFGLKSEEVDALHASGKNNPGAILEADPLLKRSLETLIDGTLIDGDDFRELYNSLIYGVDGNPPDRYFVLTDFASYHKARQQASAAWQDKAKWNRMSLLNIAGSGIFSSDRTIREYASEIWKISPRQ